MSNKNIIIDIINQKKELEKIAVYDGSNRYSYKKLYYYTESLVARLYSLNINIKCVILFLPNSFQFIISYFAVQGIAATVVPMDYFCTCYEIEESYLYCQADLILTDIEGAQKIQNLDVNYYILDNGKFIKKNKYVFNDLGKYNVVYRTSGSTNLPKFVGFENKAIFSNIKANVASLDFCMNDKTLVLLSMAFSYCMHAQVLSILYVGGTLVIGKSRILTTTEFYRTILMDKITCLMVSPNLILEYIKRDAKHSVSSLTKVCIGSDYISEDSRRKVQYHFSNATIYITYGLTEAGPRVSTLKYNMNKSLPNSVGFPIDNVEVGIYGDGCIVTNEDFVKGEIILKSASVMAGYIYNDKLTNKVIQKGWLKTGDFGYLHNKELFIEGRIKNIVKINGNLIHPEEIEECILKNKKIMDCIVFEEDNLLVADIVSDKNIFHEEIYNHCKKYLSTYKIPKKFNLVNEIKHTKNGKKNRSKYYG
ncbi:class I adenylate-forming enzyme family protein [Breznakia pachnodae]|uniref:Long-chain acyl-CoA synthetase n=1 Tax=Breznakia pachnodae TaxID=265178 RepID=A0ABU0E3R2_9FIRM|nr:class I adenylate-forming enzyme family protein [Breznakia pachnodae]MDQ0361529.1 long-chain acyl-CoA synthetase [Breznakia pachnodae]